ncbi:MAG: hypothetical protein HFJ48_01290 [Clostridia bacterium]|nr:hypothetical protein [Clostridia bacterium]
MIINNIFENWNKDCYIASLIETVEDENGNEINYYSKPKFYTFNIQQASGKTDVALYGEKVSKMYKAVISLFEYKGVFKEGDKAYLEGVTPKSENIKTYGSSANYKIVSARPQNTVIVLYFEKI